MGNLVFQATLGGQVNLVGPNTASTFNINVPTVNGNMVTTGDTGTVTNTMCATSVYTAPGTIGSGTPNTGAFTTLTTTSTINNLTVGRGAGAVSTNTAVGASALAANTTGTFSTAVGYEAGKANTNGYSITAVGARAGWVVNGATNFTAVGTDSGRTSTTAASASFFGANSGFSNTTGSYLVAVGDGALYSNTTASNNTAVGYQAGYANTTGTYNTIVGSGAGKAITTTSNSTIIGGAAGEAATGANNTFIGNFAGGYITSGAKNTIIGTYNGNQGGLDIRTASNYIVLSDGDGNPRGFFTSNGSFVIGANSPDSGTSSAYYGGYGFVNNGTTNTYAVIGHASGTASGNGFNVFAYNGSIIGSITQNGTTGVLFNTSSDYRLKHITGPITGEEAKNFIMALQPKQGTWKADGSKFVGFVAHEFQEVSPSSVSGGKDAVDADGNPVMQSMQASSPEVMANLVALIQKLVTDNEQLKSEIDKLKGQA